MELREKIRLYMSLIGVDKMPAILIAGEIETMFSKVPHALPTAPARVLTLIETTLRSRERELLDTIMIAYENTFSEKEIDDLVAFFKSDTGRRLVDLGSFIPAGVADPWLDSVMKDIRKPIEDIIDEQLLGGASPSP